MGNRRVDFDDEPLGPLEDPDDPWGVKEELVKRLPPKSEDLARRPKKNGERRRISRRLQEGLES